MNDFAQECMVAIGSNDPVQLAERIGRDSIVAESGHVILPGHKLWALGRSVVSGGATVTALPSDDPNDAVYGILYTGLTLDELDILDGYEGVFEKKSDPNRTAFDENGKPKGRYMRVKKKFVTVDGHTFDAWVYVMSGKLTVDRETHPVTPAYHERLLATCAAGAFPDWYTDMIRELPVFKPVKLDGAQFPYEQYPLVDPSIIVSAMS